MAYSSKTLDAWKNVFDSTYHQKNLGLGLDDILLRVVEETGELVKPVLTVNTQEVELRLPDVFAWICAFASKSGLSLGKAMEAKYVPRPPGRGQASISVYSIIGKDRPDGLDDWQRYLGFLYAEENRERGPHYILTKLMEDVGEASRKLRKGSSPQEVLEKLAASLAWSIALANNFNIDVGKAVWDKYPALCFRCTQSPCACSALTAIFIGYTSDTEAHVEVAKRVISELLLSARSFPDFGPSFQRARMVEMFDAISRSDGGVAILSRRYSANVYAELLEMLRLLDNNNVWILVKDKAAEDRDPQLVGLLKDIENFHRIDWFASESEFVNVLRSNLVKRLDEIRATMMR